MESQTRGTNRSNGQSGNIRGRGSGRGNYNRDGRGRGRAFTNQREGNRNYEGSTGTKEVTEQNEHEEDDTIPLVGTCQTMEKKYWRLVSKPDPSTVRPEEILKKWFEVLKNRWESHRDYEYVCDQLRAVRQDLTLQYIRNEFAVEVYESNSKIALENNDMHEFFVCLCQLNVLYEEGIAGCRDEFTAYRLLYAALTRNFFAVSDVLNKLISQERFEILDSLDDPESILVHSMEVLRALQVDDYRKFFKLYKRAPKHSKYLMRTKVDEIRCDALRAFAKAYRPTLQTEYIEVTLGFGSQQECLHFLVKNKAVLNENSSEMKCTETMQVLS
eukprot:TRINITY_DN3828_c0_g1_i1.p1 TRINITY_DN3828_c0_g1~~TRINITY_DN3828_c0_g1_i1.p1  ORF type:complete len:329 (+),score=78.97 TRINITY_DN3828_c0_g1_i1:42-1028(+)